MFKGQRQKRALLVATLVPVSGLAYGGAAAIGINPPVADLAVTSDLHVGKLGATPDQSNSAEAPATPAVEDPVGTPPESTPPADPAPEPEPATPAEPEAPPTTEPAPPTTTTAEPATPAEPGPTTPPTTTGTAPTTPTPARPVADPDPLPEPAPPGGTGVPTTDPNGEPAALDPGPALVAPPVGAPVPAVDPTVAQNPTARAADLADQRLTQHLAQVMRLAQLDKQLAPLEQSMELARDAVPAQLHARWEELHDEWLETSILVDATQLGYDHARHELAVAVAGSGNVDPERLDAAWQQADPRRMQVVFTALRQVGDPYIFNTEGPDRFDCSGLTLYAWRTAGVSLAHYSFTQRSQVPAADPAALTPGDLVFNLRSTGGHVMMSLGLDNLIVHAPGTGRFVEVSRFHNTTGFGSPLAAPDPLAVTPTAPAVPAVPTAATSAAATPSPTLATAVPAPTLTPSEPAAPVDDLEPVKGFAGAAVANELGERYGLDPALLAAQTATLTSLRPELLEALGADPADPRSVADATARYLVAATTELGDVVSGLAALEVGSGLASRSELSLEVLRTVDRVIHQADEYRRLTPAAATVPTLPEPTQAVIHVAG